MHATCYVTVLMLELDDIELICSYAEVISVSIIAYTASTVGGIFMIIWYSDCWFNTVFICTTLLLVYLMPLIALKSKVSTY